MGMEMKMGLGLKLTQKLVMTPMLQQAIKLLPLARLELAQLVQQEVIDNPLLEESADYDNPEEPLEQDPYDTYEDNTEPSTENEDPSLQEFSVEENLPEAKPSETDETPTTAEQEVDWDNFIQNNIDGGMSADSYTEKPSIEATYQKETTLAEHLQWQLGLSVDNDQDRHIGLCIIGNIQSDGYIKVPISDIVEDCNQPEEDVLRVLSLIQAFDPLGVGARSLKECLMIQAKALTPRQPLVEELIENYLERLEDRYLSKIASELKIDLSKALDALHTIREFHPRPGNRFTSEKIDYIVPDIVVVKTENGYDLILNNDDVPRLRINPYYHDLLKTAQQGETREYLEEKFKAAVWLIKSIDQRSQTIYKVGKSIVKLQKDFLDKGMAYLSPMVLKDVATDIEMHESTVSRITTNKYIDTPQGTFELKFFFHSGIKSCQGSDMSSIRVKNMIKEIVANEDPRHPLTDDQMVLALEEKNAKIARRTVTKYRKEFNIPPANKRKRLV